MAFQNITFPIVRVNDKAVFDRLQGVLNEAGYKLQSVNYNLLFGGASATEKPFEDKQFQDVLAQETLAIRSFAFNLQGGGSITVERLYEGHKPKEFHDHLAVKPPDGESNPSKYAALLKYCRKHFEALEERAFLDYLKADDKRYYEAREQSLQRLEQMQDEFFGKLQRFTVVQTEAHQKKIDELEEKYAKRLEELDDQHKNKAKTLEDERAAFEKGKKEFDDRESKHLRRQIREQLKKTLETRSKSFELTAGTQKRRWPIVGIYCLLLLLFGSGAAYFIFYDFGTASQLDWLVITRQIVFTLAFATTAGFFIRWINHWFQSHADEEFSLKRLELDIDRASWVVEMALEWKAEKGTEIPQFIIERLSRNLFVGEATEDKAMTAADMLASAIFGTAASAKLKLGDTEVALDRKGIDKLKKADGS